jgi:hypothetical protein
MCCQVFLNDEEGKMPDREVNPIARNLIVLNARAEAFKEAVRRGLISHEQGLELLNERLQLAPAELTKLL